MNLNNQEELVGLLHRIVLGGKAETDKEKYVLMQLAIALDKPPPKNSCLTCWIRRQVKQIKESYV